MRNSVRPPDGSAQADLQQALANYRESTEREGNRPHDDRRADAAGGAAEVAENLQRGHREAEAGRWEQAARFYERVLREDPQNPVAHHRLGVIADQNRDFAAAERHYNAALDARPGDPDVLNDLGYCYLLQGRYPECELTLREAVAAAPTHERALTNLGLLYGTLGDTERSLAVLRMTGSEDEARAKLAMLAPGGRQGTDVAQETAGRGSVLQASATTPVPARQASSGPTDAMRDLMDQLDRAKREAQTARAVAAGAAQRPGLINPSSATSGGDVAASPQPYQRSAREPYFAARISTDGRPAWDATAATSRSPFYGAATAPPSGGLPTWSPPAGIDPPAPRPRTTAGSQLPPAAFAGSDVTSPDGDRQWDSEAGRSEPLSTAGGSRLPSAYYPGAASSPGGEQAGRFPTNAGFEGSPSNVGHSASPLDDPRLRAYAEDLARRDAEVAEMHRYLHQEPNGSSEAPRVEDYRSAGFDPPGG